MGSCLLDLDDGSLLRILCYLTPLPDLFNVACTCQRLNMVCKDSRMHLIVDPKSQHRVDGYSRTFQSLTVAVQNSRPGDVIMLSKGVHKVSNLSISWPLIIQGHGNRQYGGGTTIVGTKGADYVLNFSASGKISGVCVQSRRGSCILHSAGNLKIDKCRLSCMPEGRGYIYCCVVSIASNAHSFNEQNSGRNKSNKRKRDEQSHIGVGVLTVCDTICSSSDTVSGSRLSNSVVHCRGTGQLRNVRIAVRKTGYGGDEECSMWWTIDSSVPGIKAPPPGLEYLRQSVHLGDDGGDIQLPFKRRRLSQHA
eukprot:TRINITY_DN44046_c0_g1_i4.p1 TRINITY_DN44046_c0_g1~~TRINITY_DN44046_c0_g1_i4.p1  ORF type:complete len:308 (+),score=26.81 TRINITY_DN44046_c0_g1_i4:53-976(+)